MNYIDKYKRVMEIATAFTNGTNRKTIMKRYKISRQTLWRYLRETTTLHEGKFTKKGGEK